MTTSMESGLRSVRPPNEFDNRIDVLGLLDRADQRPTLARRLCAGEQEQGGRAVTGAEALRPDQDATVADPDRLPEDVGEVRRLAIGRFLAAAVTQRAAAVTVAVGDGDSSAARRWDAHL
ncbi:hypothetical protein ABZ793_20910 [Micromonospora sp. NPDC047465]|uniref:hypothetical protein n=1 Tax=Micromonospora sp. NPDC047465 TaxID=3154813 RepID=UPI00340FFEB8